MAPKSPIPYSPYPCHVTCKSIGEKWFAPELGDVWNLCLSTFKEAYDKYPVDVISFVLMSNHYHLLAKASSGNLDRFVATLNKKLEVIGDDCEWNMIRATSYFRHCYRYIYQNPLRAGLVQRCEDYPYSTLFYKYRGLSFPIPLADSYGFGYLYRVPGLSVPGYAVFRSGLTPRKV